MRAGILRSAVHVDLHLSPIKPKPLKWIKKGMEAVAANQKGIVAAWASTDYMDCWSPDMQQRAKEAFADGTLQIHVIRDEEEPAEPPILNNGGEDEEGNEDYLDRLCPTSGTTKGGATYGGTTPSSGTQG